MYEQEVRPHITTTQGRIIKTSVLHTIGLGESEVAQRLGELMDRGRVPLVGTTASGGIVSVRVRYEGRESPEAAEGRMLEAIARIRCEVGEFVFREGDGTIADAVIGRLRSRGARLATVESCTGGMLGQAITAIAGSSDAFVGGWVTYSNEMKERMVGVPRELLDRHGAVSMQVAGAMATGGRERSGADHCLSITGIAGPGGGSVEKPVGTVWIGLASGRDPVECRRFLMRGGREAVREWSVTSALAMLDLRLRGRGGVKLLRQQEP